MQLNLLTRLGARVVMSRAEPPSTVPGAWRDSAISQLEALARANERAAARARRRRRLWTAALSGVVLLWGAAMWRQAIDPPRVPAPMLARASTPAAPIEPAAAPVVAEMSLASAAPTLLAAAPVAAEAADSATAPPSSVVTDAVPVVASVDDEATRKARAQWLARRKAAQLAQERARAEQEVQQRQLALAAQLDAERTLQQQLSDAAARERAAAAERERRQALLLAQHTRRGVVELCANSGGVAGEQQCHTRQCWKGEHQGDPVCARLREGELARLQRGADH
jgi:hypothetical protein